jgi:hypothetical protein
MFNRVIILKQPIHKKEYIGDEVLEVPAGIILKNKIKNNYNYFMVTNIAEWPLLLLNKKQQGLLIHVSTIESTEFEVAFEQLLIE